MKINYKAWLRFEWIIIALILFAFYLPWISWGKMVIAGFDLPSLYKKTTKISNTIMFFAKKESAYMAYYIYLVPALSVLSAIFLLRLRYVTANVLLMISSFAGFAVSIYMYTYFLDSKMFKLIHAGAGIHLLCIVSLVGFIYSLTCICKRKRKHTEEIIEKNTLVVEEVNVSVAPEE